MGPAPVPPPSKLAGNICSGEPFEWGTCWGDGCVEMDAGIIGFKSEDVLEVSYGDDGPHGGAKKRRLLLFRLG